MSSLFGISGLLPSLAPSVDTRGKKKTQGTHYLVVTWALRFLVSLLLSNFESSYVCFMYNVQCFSMYLVGNTGKTIPIASSCMWTVLKLWQIFSFHLPVQYRTLNLSFGRDFFNDYTSFALKAQCFQMAE